LNNREKAWAETDALLENSAAHKIARFGLGWSFEQLPNDVVHMAKRCLLDTIGCAIGALSAKGQPICETVAQSLGGTPQATIIGSGLKTNVLNATLVNSFMVRYLDYNDLGGGGHNSDAIPALLAVAEVNDKSGEDFLNALVLSYELGGRFLKALSTGDISSDYKRFTGYGWCPDVRGGINLPTSLGLLMDLTEEQVAGAIGATSVRSLPMNHLDANNEEFVMSKNLRYGFVAYDAVMSCLLTQQGFTGPRRGLDGEYGYFSTVLDGMFNMDILINPEREYDILQTCFKPLCTNYTTQTGIQSTIYLCETHDILPEDVAAVTILATGREAIHTTAPAKKYPRNGESADHSAFYGNSLAIIERGFGPRSFKDEKFNDPLVLELTEKITVETVEDWPYFSNWGGSVITLKDGTEYKKVMENPHGHITNPMSDEELVDKFMDMALDFMSEVHAKRIVETIWKCEELESMRELTSQFAFLETPT